MNANEKYIVRNAIKELLADEGDFTGAIGNLCNLVGLTYPAAEVRGMTTLDFNTQMIDALGRMGYTVVNTAELTTDLTDVLP